MADVWKAWWCLPEREASTRTRAACVVVAAVFAYAGLAASLALAQSHTSGARTELCCVRPGGLKACYRSDRYSCEWCQKEGGTCHSVVVVPRHLQPAPGWLLGLWYLVGAGTLVLGAVDLRAARKAGDRPVDRALRLAAAAACLGLVVGLLVHATLDRELLARELVPAASLPAAIGASFGLVLSFPVAIGCLAGTGVGSMIPWFLDAVRDVMRDSKSHSLLGIEFIIFAVAALVPLGVGGLVGAVLRGLIGLLWGHAMRRSDAPRAGGGS